MPEGSRPGHPDEGDEFQAYHDPRFRRRLFEGHLVCIGRYPDRIVVSLALWLIRPHPEENW